VVGAGGQGGVQGADQSGQTGGHLGELAGLQLSVDLGHLVPHDLQGQYQAIGVASVEAVQGQADCFGGGVGVSVGWCGYRQFGQLAWGDLQGVG
jgi:hypothetical protein